VGAKWKQAIKAIMYTVNIQTHGTVMASETLSRHRPYLSRCVRQPLLRMTFDWKENDIKMTQFVTGKAVDIAQTMAANR